jgi:hypothetical protein
MFHRHRESTERIFVGIDPGLDGAVAILALHGEFLEVADTPVVEVSSMRTRHSKTEPGTVKHVKGTRREFEEASMRIGLEQVRHAGLLAIEQVGPMPKEGAIASFNFGFGVGLWMGLLSGLMISRVRVRPQVWKGYLTLPADKQAIRLAAIQRWPAAANMLKLKKHHGRAEALWLAEYARQRSVIQQAHFA